MTPKIGGVAGSAGLELPAIAPAGAPATSDGVDFANELGRAIGEAGKSERSSADAAARFAAGDPQIGLHEVMIASEKASISVRYAVTLQKKLIEAYREIMNTNI